jgi:hypothetical protein
MTSSCMWNYNFLKFMLESSPFFSCRATFLVALMHEQSCQCLSHPWHFIRAKYYCIGQVQDSNGGLKQPRAQDIWVSQPIMHKLDPWQLFTNLLGHSKMSLCLKIVHDCFISLPSHFIIHSYYTISHLTLCNLSSW